VNFTHYDLQHQPRGTVVEVTLSGSAAFESLTWDVTKFTFGAYTTILATSIGVYTFSVEQGRPFLPVAVILLAVSLIVGLFGDVGDQR
jgi:hypothetical protein